MKLRKIGYTWIDPDQIVAAQNSRPVTPSGTQSGVKLLMAGGHVLEFTGADREAVLELLASRAEEGVAPTP